jgi:hemerythrin-like domain-containing protein
MRNCGSGGAGEALAQLAELESDHGRAHELHDAVDRLGSRWLEQNELPAAEGSHLTALLEELSQIYQRHIRLEEERVFPLAARLLDRQALDAVGGEMAARRSVRYEPAKR